MYSLCRTTKQNYYQNKSKRNNLAKNIQKNKIITIDNLSNLYNLYNAYKSDYSYNLAYISNQNNKSYKNNFHYKYYCGIIYVRRKSQ